MLLFDFFRAAVQAPELEMVEDRPAGSGRSVSLN
jgi:hypothetical protein